MLTSECAWNQVLAAFLKSIGFIIPLMDSMYANYYTREVMVILIREFQTPDEEMKKIVLKVCPPSDPSYLCTLLQLAILTAVWLSNFIPITQWLPQSVFQWEGMLFEDCTIFSCLRKGGC